MSTVDMSKVGLTSEYWSV